MPRFVDLSIYLENDVLSDSPMLARKIEYQKHKDTLPEFLAMLPGTKPEARKFIETGNKNLQWEGHKAGKYIGCCHLEKLHNLEAFPGDGFTVCGFPHKIRGASAGWTRAVAIFQDCERKAPCVS